MRLKDRFQIVRPLEEMELRLVRASAENPNLLEPSEEALLRTSLSLARLYCVRSEDQDVTLEGEELLTFRDEVTRRFGPVLLEHAITREALLPLLRDFADLTRTTRDELIRGHRHRVLPGAVDQELRHKKLVLVAGGGGGTGYVYMGAMSLLDEHGLSPALMVGTSMGAILSLFRSRLLRFDQAAMVNAVRRLSFRKLFRVISTENRYGMPAALRLYLRAGIGSYFNASASTPGFQLRELRVPTIVAVGGIRRGMLPQPLSFYERLFQGKSPLNPMALAGSIQNAMSVLTEFLNRPEMLVKLHLGADEETWGFDALDAAGFSSALPGVIHYDVLREDLRMRELLDGLFEQKELFRLTDGGVVDNLPAKAAWQAVHRGRIGTRNAFVLALNAFSMKFSTPLWLPLQRLAEVTAAPNRPFAHFIKDFGRTLSPLELVPSVEKATRAIELGRGQLLPDMPLISRMLTPLPPLA